MRGVLLVYVLFKQNTAYEMRISDWSSDVCSSDLFKGNINEEVAVTLTAEGLYGVKCSPHFAMGMAMPIEVGAARAKATDRPEGLPSRAKTRFEEILLRAGRH